MARRLVTKYREKNKTKQNKTKHDKKVLMHKNAWGGNGRGEKKGERKRAINVCFDFF